MEEIKDKQIMQRVIDKSLSGIQDDPFMAQRVLNQAHAMQRTGGFVVKKKLSVGFVLLMAAMLLSVTALAAVLLSPKDVVEQIAVPIAQKNEQMNYQYEELTELMRSLNENGITLDEGSRMMQAFHAGHGYWEQDTIREICIAAFGGDERGWSVEQRHWYGEIMVSLGAWDVNIWLIPEEGELSVEEARACSAQAIKDAYGVDLPTESDDAWLVQEVFELMWDEATDTFPRERAQWTFWYADRKTGNDRYTVVLARDGRVMECYKTEKPKAFFAAANPYPKEDEAIAQYGSVMHYWPFDVQIEVYGEPYAIPSDAAYKHALAIAEKAIVDQFGEEALIALGAHKIGCLHTSIEDEENDATQMHWDFMFTTDTTYLSDGYRVQFYQIVDHRTGSERIDELCVEHANMGNG